MPAAVPTFALLPPGIVLVSDAFAATAASSLAVDDVEAPTVPSDPDELEDCDAFFASSGTHSDDGGATTAFGEVIS